MEVVRVEEVRIEGAWCGVDGQRVEMVKSGGGEEWRGEGLEGGVAGEGKVTNVVHTLDVPSLRGRTLPQGNGLCSASALPLRMTCLFLRGSGEGVCVCVCVCVCV